MDHRTRTIVKRPLTTLQAHPSRALLFCAPPRHEIKELAADIERNGLIQPVEILPDGTILCGHKRIDAARLLGWTEIDAWVRDDLAQDPVAAETRLIADNLSRRQMAPLELARCYQRLTLLGCKDGASRMTAQDKRELREQIGQRLGVSRRNLDRLLRIGAHAPQEVQDAVASGKLPMTTGERVVGLTVQQREQIASAIREGGYAKEVVRPFLAAVPKPPGTAARAKDSLVRALARAVMDLQGRVSDVRSLSAEDVRTLAQGERLIRRLRRRTVTTQQASLNAPPVSGEGAEVSAAAGDRHDSQELQGDMGPALRNVGDGIVAAELYGVSQNYTHNRRSRGLRREYQWLASARGSASALSIRQESPAMPLDEGAVESEVKKHHPRQGQGRGVTQ